MVFYARIASTQPPWGDARFYSSVQGKNKEPGLL